MINDIAELCATVAAPVLVKNGQALIIGTGVLLGILSVLIFRLYTRDRKYKQ